MDAVVRAPYEGDWRVPGGGARNRDCTSRSVVVKVAPARCRLVVSFKTNGKVIPRSGKVVGQVIAQTRSGADLFPSDARLWDNSLATRAGHTTAARTPASSGLLRARVRARNMDHDYYFDSELAALKRATTNACSAAARLVWRAAMQRRTRRIRTILETVPELVPSAPTRQVKRPGVWDVVVDGTSDAPITVMTLHIHTPGRSLEELAMPIPVQVHQEERVDAGRLRQLERAGVVQVVPAARSGP